MSTWPRYTSASCVRLRRLAGMELIHTCYRVTDPERSIAFYEALGLEKRRELPIRDEAVNYFLGVPGKPQPELELTHNFGVDSYELGTAYGHIALTIEDMAGTLAALAEKGIEPERPPYSVREGGSLLCFVRDPDGYRIELIERSDY
jgi:lactoylglutathione lyase